MRRVLRVVGALLLASALASPTDAQPRPLVLVVHGRGQGTRDSAALRRDALNALRDAARAVAGESGAELLRDDDVRVVWYADLLDPRREPATCASSPVENRDGSPLGALALIAGALLGAAADDAQASKDSAGAGTLRALVGDMRFFGDGTTRCAAERRVGDALDRAHSEHRPVVLVAHSLGGIVAWGYLRHRAAPDAPDVQRFVTLGSPLGSPDVRRIVFGDDTTPLALPPAVRSWVNVLGTGDPFATHLLADSAAASAELSDVTTEAPHDDPHDLVGYLRDPATARAVLGAWCEAAHGLRAACDPLRSSH